MSSDHDTRQYVHHDKDREGHDKGHGCQDEHSSNPDGGRGLPGSTFVPPLPGPTHGTMRCTGLPRIATLQVVTSLDVPVPVMLYRIFHQPSWSPM